jgi:hypothetical protein
MKIGTVRAALTDLLHSSCQKNSTKAGAELVLPFYHLTRIELAELQLSSLRSSSLYEGQGGIVRSIHSYSVLLKK